MRATGRIWIRLNPADYVVVALQALARGAEVAEAAVRLVEDIPAGHKAALVAIRPGAPVIKYGQVIGFASQEIAPGRHVHTHNVVLHDFNRDYAFGADAAPTAIAPDPSAAVSRGSPGPTGGSASATRSASSPR